MKQRGVLLPYDSPVAHSVPVGLKDPDGTWVADRLTQYVIQYNTKSITGAAIRNTGAIWPRPGSPISWSF